MMRDSSPPDAIFDERPRVLALVRREHQLDAIGAGRAERARLDDDRQLAPRAMPSSASAAPTSFSSRRAACVRRLRQRGGGGDRGGLGGRARGLRLGELRVAAGERVELGAQLGGLGDRPRRACRRACA